MASYLETASSAFSQENYQVNALNRMWQLFWNKQLKIWLISNLVVFEVKYHSNIEFIALVGKKYHENAAWKELMLILNF